MTQRRSSGKRANRDLTEEATGKPAVEDGAGISPGVSAAGLIFFTGEAFDRTTHEPPPPSAPGLAGCERSREVNSTEENSVSYSVTQQQSTKMPPRKRDSKTAGFGGVLPTLPPRAKWVAPQRETLPDKAAQKAIRRLSNSEATERLLRVAASALEEGG